MPTPAIIKARACIDRAFKDLHRHINKQFSAHTEASRRDLQSGIFGRQLFLHAKRSGLNEKDVWGALFNFCLIAGARGGEIELAEGLYFNLSWPALWYAEKINAQSPIDLNLSPSIWASYIYGLSQADQRRSVLRFCDWVEASFALFSYRLYKTNVNCFQADQFAACVNIFVERLNAAADALSEIEKDKIFSESIIELKRSFNRSMPVWEAAKLHESKPSEWRHPELDVWLFEVWPFVKHFDWTHQELLNVIAEKKNRKPDGKFAALNLDANPCRNYKTLGTHTHTRLGLNHPDRPRGQPKLRSGDHPYLPPRWWIAVNL